MNIKLTLFVDKKVIEQAKKYARRKNMSLSNLIENYLCKVSALEQEEPYISPLVRSMSGVAPLPKGFDHKKGYSDFLARKYRLK